MQTQPLILGLGQTGLSLIAHFTRSGKTPLLVDTRPAPPLLDQLKKTFPQVRCQLASRFRLEGKAVSSAWASPGFPLHHPLTKELHAQGIAIGNDIELFVQALRGCSPRPAIIAVTGTNGKSTVCSMLGHALRQEGVKVQVAGNIGLPVARLMHQPLDAEVYVLELSSFQLMYLRSLCGHSGCILNIAADHLDRHASMDEYVSAKQRIYTASQAQVCNSDDTATWPDEKSPAHNRYFFGPDQPPAQKAPQRTASLRNGHLCFGNQPVLSLDAFAPISRYNLRNLLASIALLASINRLQAARHLVSYSHLPHRSQLLGKKRQRWFINDSKATNPQAAIHSITSLAEQYPGLIVIAGGDAKQLDLSPLGATIANHCAALVTLGKDGPRLASVANGIATQHAASMREAVEKALALSTEGDCIALCPGCASTDMFSNYAERGDRFAACAEKL